MTGVAAAFFCKTNFGRERECASVIDLEGLNPVQFRLLWAEAFYDLYADRESFTGLHC